MKPRDKNFKKNLNKHKISILISFICVSNKVQMNRLASVTVVDRAYTSLNLYIEVFILHHIYLLCYFYNIPMFELLIFMKIF